MSGTCRDLGGPSSTALSSSLCVSNRVSTGTFFVGPTCCKNVNSYSTLIMNHSIATPQASARRQTNSLAILDPTKPHRFIKPVKRINEGHDVTHFLTSQAYTDIMTFLMQLNVAMCPRKTDSGQVEAWELDTHMSHPEPVERLRALLQRVEEMIAEAPPDPGPRRFGNVSFRTWHNLLEKRAPELLQEFLAPTVLEFRTDPADSDSPLDELSSYFLGAFGSSQRLDYGTGHELSFLAFLGALWKLGGFGKLESPEDGSLERTIVIGVIERYVGPESTVCTITFTECSF